MIGHESHDSSIFHRISFETLSNFRCNPNYNHENANIRPIEEDNR